MWVMLHSAFAMAIDAEYFGMSKCLVLHSCIFNQVPVSFIIAARPPPTHTDYYDQNNCQENNLNGGNFILAYNSIHFGPL